MTLLRKSTLFHLSWFILAGAAVFVASAASTAGCGSSDTSKAPPLTGSGGAGAGGSGSSSPTSSGPGAGAGNPNAVCGNDVKEGGEQCDGPDFGNIDCTTLGFSGGTLKCTKGCKYDESGCTGNENCQDGVDNDGDGKIDCKDSDCANACESACTKLPTLPDDSTVLTTGLTTGHAIGPKPSCASAAAGPETAYTFVAKHTGFLDVEVGTKPTNSDPLANLTLSVRKTCSDATTELGCDNENTGLSRTLILNSIPVTAGDSLTIAVDGFTASDSGAYTIFAETHELKCGDSHVDPPEQCDDGNTDSNDGCSATCQLEPSEVEPNDTRAEANAWSAPWFGQIKPAGDVDCVSIKATANDQMLTAETDDTGDGACGSGLQDSYLVIYDSSGTVLNSSDSGGDGLCARAMTGNELVSGDTYYVCVSAGPGSAGTTFPYKLILTLM